jgi:hypothetical protein
MGPLEAVNPDKEGRQLTFALADTAPRSYRRSSRAWRTAAHAACVVKCIAQRYLSIYTDPCSLAGQLM